MESKVQRYVFRVLYRRETHQFTGRIVEHEDGRFSLQMWATSPQHANILIEVAPVDERDDVWPLFHKAANHRGMTISEYRPEPLAGEDWQMVPGGA